MEKGTEKLIVMKKRVLLLLLALILASMQVTTEAKDTFEIGNGSFMLNGEPFVVKAAELHYPRIPRPYRYGKSSTGRTSP